MGEYTSTAKKPKEILTVLTLFGLGIGVFYCSQIPSIPYPLLFQIGAVLLLTAAIYILFRFVLRRFTSRLELNEQGTVDFVVVEHYGNRNTVLCRVYANQILSAVRWSKEAKKEFQPQRKGKRVYHFVGSFSAQNRILVEILEREDGGGSFFLELEADDAFLSLLNEHCGSRSTSV